MQKDGLDAPSGRFLKMKKLFENWRKHLNEGDGQVSNRGGLTGGLGALDRFPPTNPADIMDSEIQARAMAFLMDLGLEEKVSRVFVKNIAVQDLQAVMEAVPKIDTAAEGEDELDEVSSEKQRRWACAQKDKPASQRADSLSAAEAEEMCTSKIEEDD